MSVRWRKTRQMTPKWFIRIPNTFARNVIFIFVMDVLQQNAWIMMFNGLVMLPSCVNHIIISLSLLAVDYILLKIYYSINSFMIWGFMGSFPFFKLQTTAFLSIPFLRASKTTVLQYHYYGHQYRISSHLVYALINIKIDNPTIKCEL